jgi:hypothetical protein
MALAAFASALQAQRPFGEFTSLRRICDRNASESIRQVSLQNQNSEKLERDIWIALSQLADLEHTFYNSTTFLKRSLEHGENDSVAGYRELHERVLKIIQSITDVNDKAELLNLARLLECRMFIVGLMARVGSATKTFVDDTNELYTDRQGSALLCTKWAAICMAECLSLARISLAREAVEFYNFKDAALNLFLAKHLMTGENLANISARQFPIHKQLFEYYNSVKLWLGLVFDGPIKQHERVKEDEIRSDNNKIAPVPLAERYVRQRILQH